MQIWHTPFQSQYFPVHMEHNVEWKLRRAEVTASCLLVSAAAALHFDLSIKAKVYL